MSWIELIGYFGVALNLCIYSARRMIPLRIFGICTNCVFIVYAYLAGVYPQLLLNILLLPINIYRLYEMLALIRDVKSATHADLDMEWIKPHMRRRTTKRGEVIFAKGNVSDAMYYTVGGRYRLKEIDQEVAPGQLIGEIGLIAPDNKRTMTFECVDDGVLLTVSYDHVKELYFQNPTFGFYFLQLISQRLFKDIQRLQQAGTETAASVSPAARDAPSAS